MASPCKRRERTEKTGINFPVPCQGKWKANSCIVAESTYFSLSAYLSINLPLSQVHASVSIALLTWLSLEKATNAPTEKGIAKMWSKGSYLRCCFVSFCLWKLHSSLQWKQIIALLTKPMPGKALPLLVLWNFFENKSSPLGEENFETFRFSLLSFENGKYVYDIFIRKCDYSVRRREMWSQTRFGRDKVCSPLWGACFLHQASFLPPNPFFPLPSLSDI